MGLKNLVLVALHAGSCMRVHRPTPFFPLKHNITLMATELDSIRSELFVINVSKGIWEGLNISGIHRLEPRQTLRTLI